MVVANAVAETTKAVTEAVEEVAEPVKEEAKEETAKEVVVEEEEETVEEEKVVEAKCTPATISDGVEVDIIKITTFKKTDTFAKVTKVMAKVQNADDEAFIPKLAISIANDDSVREVYMEEVEAGCQFTQEFILPSMGISYTDIDEEKTLEVKVLDGSKVKDTDTAKFTTSS